MIGALMMIISNYGIKYLCNLLQLEPCCDMFKVICDLMAYCYVCKNTITVVIYLLHLISWQKMICALMFITSNQYGIKCLSNLLQLEQRNDMFKVIFDIMAQCYDM